MTQGSDVARRRRTLAVVVLVCFTGQSFARFSFGLLLPAMKADLRVSYGLAGWLGTINLLGYLAGTLLTSVAAVRVPAHRLMQAGCAAATIGMGLLAVSSSIPVLLCGMALGGVGGAAAWIPAPIMAASVFPVERRAFAMSATSAAIGGGIVVATALSRTLRALAGDSTLWRPVWVVETGVGVVATALALVALRPVAAAAGTPPRVSVLRQAPRWWAPTLAYTCFGFGYVLFATFLVSALQADAGFAPGHAANVFALIGLGNAIGALTVGRIVGRYGQRLLLGAMFLLAGAGCLAVLVGHEPVVSIATFGFGFGMAGAVVSLTSYLGRTLRPQDFAAAFGVMTACFGVGQAIGPRLGGVIADRAGSFDALFALAATVWVAGAAMALWMPSHAALTAAAAAPESHAQRPTK